MADNYNNDNNNNNNVIGTVKSRWSNLHGGMELTSDSWFVNEQRKQQQQQQQIQSVRRFLYEKEDNGDSNFVRCYYSDMNNNYVRCEKQFGCCDTGCCPVVGQFEWLSGVYVLIAFVVLIVAVCLVAGIVCYQRSKSKALKEANAYDQYAQSHYTAYPYQYPAFHSDMMRGTNSHFGLMY
ncbi:hypothetical protein T12_6644 [Trichinella patagoniensis]|uniref:CX domain-containing protein n=1 Tax=Trichinella patagoniensis TaxID=990121 RepID=A0A0V0ZGE5_9BILA|nr:hypothetical protein T12_13016 [Trichinella patagoniensis]KRY18300.1 hypothetical protein T12_6644 [Trichinella patagoniensis]